MSYRKQRGGGLVPACGWFMSSVKLQVICDNELEILTMNRAKL